MPTRHLVNLFNQAAQLALAAPALLGSPPWRWQVVAGALELRADWTRQPETIDSRDRLSVLSCGVALHHIRVAVAAAGHRAAVARFPDPADPDLIARIRRPGWHYPDAHEQALARAIHYRRTDQHEFAERPVPPEVLSRLHAVVEAECAILHVVDPAQTILQTHAPAAERADTAYPVHMNRWTRPPSRRKGNNQLPVAGAQQAPRRRRPDRGLHGQATRRRDSGRDHGGHYTVVSGPDDTPLSWLRAGEGVSALLLTALIEGLSATPIPEALELPQQRTLMRELLAGKGEPHLIVRLGFAPRAGELSGPPGRDATRAAATIR